VLHGRFLDGQGKNRSTAYAAVLAGHNRDRHCRRRASVIPMRLHPSHPRSCKCAPPPDPVSEVRPCEEAAERAIDDHHEIGARTENRKPFRGLQIGRQPGDDGVIAALEAYGEQGRGERGLQQIGPEDGEELGKSGLGPGVPVRREGVALSRRGMAFAASAGIGRQT
jgi:hypothetical protein